MKDNEKTKDQLLEEIAALRRRVSDTENDAEGDTQQNRHLLTMVADNIPAYVAYVGMDDLRYRFVNENFEHSFGIPREKIIGSHIRDIIEDSNYQFAKKYLAIVRSGKAVSYENAFELAEGKRWVKVNYVPDFDEKGTVQGVVVLGYDITEQKHIEEALQQERNLFLHGPTVVLRWLAEEEWPVDYASPNLQNMLGYEPVDFTSGRIRYVDLIHPDDLQRIIDDVEKNLASNVDYYEQEYRLKAANGEYRWLHDCTNVVRDASGQVKSFHGYIQDITDRKQFEEALQLSEVKYRTLFEGSTNPIVIYDRDGTILLINGVGAKNLGLSAEECIGKSIFDLLPEIDDSYRELYRQVVDKGIEATNEDYVELPTGPKWFLSVIQPVTNISGKRYAVQTISYDITEQKRSQEELLKTQKLESLGVLAGGIAHDFNNLLGGMLGYVDMARMEVRGNTIAADYLEKALPAFSRAKDLTQQLLTFSKGGLPIKRPMELHSILSQSTGLSLSGSTVKCKFMLSPSLHMVNADEGQLHQVFNNILLNSRQAMPNGGTVTIEASNRELQSKEIPPLPQGSYVEISVSDQGTGIPDNLLSKIFDPFFSTKQQGSGLGLATSYSIIKKHGGLITAHSVMGEGTTITVLLPATDSLAESDAEDKPAALACTGKVLLMDDEQVILDMSAEIIRRTGCEVVCVKDGEEAIQKYEESIEKDMKFDAVILDLTVPAGLGGEETIKRLHKLDPEVKGIVSSGYSDSPVLARPEEFGFLSRVTKPYTFRELAQTLNAILNKEVTPAKE